MIEKRFTIKDSMLKDRHVIIDNEKEYTFPVLDSTLNYMFCKALNELHEENEQLKSYTGEMEDYLARLDDENEQLKSFKSEVFELIDKKINKLKNTNEVSLIPRESVEILKELKKELEE